MFVYLRLLFIILLLWLIAEVEQLEIYKQKCVPPIVSSILRSTKKYLTSLAAAFTNYCGFEHTFTHLNKHRTIHTQYNNPQDKTGVGNNNRVEWHDYTSSITSYKQIQHSYDIKFWLLVESLPLNDPKEIVCWTM